MESDAPPEVVGGDPARGKFPEVVFLTDELGTVPCTGVLIAQKTVLTARHCITDGAGALNTAVKFGDDKRNPTFVARVIAEPIAMPTEYPVGTRASASDIALVRIDSQPRNISPAPIASPARLQGRTANSAIRVVGFGRTLADDPTTVGRKFSARQIISTADCKGAVKRMSTGASYSDASFYGCEPNQIVASGRVQHGSVRPPDTCAGDSGGPAYVSLRAVTAPVSNFEAAFARGSRLNYAVAGITAKGISQTPHIARSSEWTCGQGGIYTRISEIALQWVKETLQRQNWGAVTVR